MIKVYGVPGWGSAISEVMLTLADIPFSSSTLTGLISPAKPVNFSKNSTPCARCRPWSWKTARS